MIEDISSEPIRPHSIVRTLKIEETGDFWKGVTLPKIRLRGRWLERAGFNPGSYVQVTCVSHGVIELRAQDAALVMLETPSAPALPPTGTNEPDYPF